MAANNNPILDYMYKAYYHSRSTSKDCCYPQPWLNFNGPVNANCHPLYNLPEPKTPCSAATKKYVDRQTSNSGSIEFTQDKNTAQKVINIDIDQLDQLRNVIVSLNDRSLIEILERRLKSFYTRNITSNTFQLVMNMEANFEKAIANVDNNSSTTNIMSALVNIAGRPSISLPNASPLDGGSYPNPALFRSKNGTGDAGLTEITTSTGMGTSLGIIDSRPATVFIRDGNVIYSHCSHTDGTGTWNNIIVTSTFDPDVNNTITNVSDPVELNRGVFFLMWNRPHQGDRFIYSAISTDVESSTWFVKRVDNARLVNQPATKLHPIAHNGRAQFATHINGMARERDTLYYYEADDERGSTWDRRLITTRTAIFNPTAIVTPDNKVAIYFAFSNTLNASNKLGKLTGFIKNANDFISIPGPIIDNFILSTINFSFSNVNGNVAVAYFIFGAPFNSPFNLMYQYSDSSGRNWKEPVPIKQSLVPDHLVFSLTLADINNAPCVVTNEVQFIRSNYVYYRGGNRSTFVQDADVTANYSLN